MSRPDGAHAATGSTAHRFPRKALEYSIPDRFRAMAVAHPNRIAVEYGGTSVTYSALDGRAGAIARMLADVPGPGARIALFFPQGVDLIAAMLGVLESGHAYLPLASGMSEDEIRDRVLRSGAAVLMTSPALAGAAERAVDEACDVRVLSETAGPGAPDRERAVVRPAALACLYFTSGTTGAARGVMDCHRNVLHNVMRYSNTLGFSPDDRMTVVQASTFSGVMSSVFGALLNGATLLPYDLAAEGAGPPLGRWIDAVRPTIFHSVPTIFRSLCGGGRRFMSIRLVRLEGDVATPRDVALFRTHFADDAVLVNGLGATETGLCRQFFVRRDTPVPVRVLPVGGAVTDMRVDIVDAQGRAVAAGEPGEILVSSAYLALGYWGDDVQTAARFGDVEGRPGTRCFHTGDTGRLDATGCLEHLGRRDDQIKLSGEWIDVATIERACEWAPGITAAVITHERDPEGEIGLAAYLIASPGSTPQWDSVQRHLLAQLPAFMVPRNLWLIEALPVTLDGKVKRSALAALDARRLVRDVQIVAPRSSTERQLVAIWSSVLEVQHLGVHDRFDDLGGTSLGAARVLAGIEAQMGRILTLADIVETATIAGLAELLERTTLVAPRGHLVRIQPDGTRTPLFCVHDLESDVFLFSALARSLGHEQPLFGLRYASGEPANEVPMALHDLAERYVKELRGVAPEGPYRLAGFCFGGVVALEMAHQLLAAGHEVDRLALLNVTPFDFPNLVSGSALRRFRNDWLARARYIARKDGRWRWLRERIARTWLDRVSGWTDRGALRSPVPDGPADAECVRARLMHAFRTHRSRPFPAPVLLALAEETLPLYANDAYEAWRPICDTAPVILRQTRDGYAMLVPPGVDLLAPPLGEWLERGAIVQEQRT